MVEDGIREIVYDADGPFLKWELVRIGTGRSEFTVVHVNRCPFMLFHLSRFTLLN